ncbi:MAG TPA: succinate dehydrogenase [Actinomycetota bacterium]|nr:succinate dehydrogenase [Actinomycetota bacterium]
MNRDGRDLRAERGPVLRKGVGVSPSGWFDPRGRTIGGWAFAVNRITGLGLVFYLYLHLAVLSLLLGGADAWNDFLRIATTSVFLLLDVLLVFGLLYHGLNGVRVALIGTGLVPGRERALFWAGTVIGTIALIAAGLHILGDA